MDVESKEKLIDIDLIKVTNPLWMESLAPFVKKYHDKIKHQGLTYESLMDYLTKMVQFGGELSEFWVAFKNKVPVGFCLWFVMGAPLIGVTHCDQIYVWDDDDRISKLFMEKFIEFSVSKRAPILHALLVNKKVADHFTAVGDSVGVVVEETQRVELVGRRK